MDRPLVVLSAKTAALRGAPHLVELGAVRFVDGEAQQSFEELVCPPVPIEPEATAVHGIDEGDVRAARLAGEVLARFSGWLGADWIAAHDLARESEALAFELARAGLEPPPGPWLDARRLAARALPEAPDHDLATLVQLLEIEESRPGRALSDAVSCWKVVEECLERAGGPASVRATELLAALGPPWTLASRIPPRPRLARRLRALGEALGAGAAVTVLYGEAGDLAPAPIELTPRFLYQRGGEAYLEAECSSSGLLKTYRLDRVHRVL